MPAYSSSDAQRPPAYVMSRIGSHAVHDRREIIRFRDEPLMNNGQVTSSNHDFSRIGSRYSRKFRDILFLEIFKKRNVQQAVSYLHLLSSFIILDI